MLVSGKVARVTRLLFLLIQELLHQVTDYACWVREFFTLEKRGAVFEFVAKQARDIAL